MTPCMLASAIPMISVFTAREMSQQIALARSSNPQIAQAEMRHSPQRTTSLNEGTPILKFPSYVMFRTEYRSKTINVFSHFHGLIPDTDYKHSECFVMLRTHICDISPLRFNLIISKSYPNKILFYYRCCCPFIWTLWCWQWKNKHG